jgi:hypothetical protein
MNNTIFTIAPYRHLGSWAFDDNNAGLVAEPFVCGIPEMIDTLLKERLMTDVDKFRLRFSTTRFPGYQAQLIKLHEEHGGNWYQWTVNEMEGWLCPILFKYFATAPKSIYLKAEKL